jgi:hypothetical protein
MWSFGLVGWVGFESPHTHKRAKSKKLYLFLKKKLKELMRLARAGWLDQTFAVDQELHKYPTPKNKELI